MLAPVICGLGQLQEYIFSTRSNEACKLQVANALIGINLPVHLT